MANTHDEPGSSPVPIVLLWSGGKDAVLALDALADADAYRVCALLVTVRDDDETVTMHGTPLALIEAQSDALGRPLHVMHVPPSPSNATYEKALERALAPVQADQVHTVAVGDIFLEDVRAYRESVLGRLGMEALFPLWNADTSDLARWFLDRGYEAVVTSVDTTQLDPAFAGRRYDASFLASLPEGVDPCGEHGAFHTFVTGGPLFTSPVPVTVQEVRGDGRMAYARVTAS